MKKPSQVALVAAGKITDWPLARAPLLSIHLGPVHAQSFRVARRIANTLRAGYAVSDYRGFDTCALVLISVPDELVPGVVKELAGGVTWPGKAVVLCSCRLGAGQLGELAEQGALTGSLSVIAGADDNWFLLEGARALDRYVRPILERPGIRITSIGHLQKPSYVAAMNCLGPALTPLVIEAADRLKGAGVPKPEIAAILERQAARTMRSYLKFGKKLDQLC